jgi:glycosyltransferase involved in cell wall biosynthesis
MSVLSERRIEFASPDERANLGRRIDDPPLALDAPLRTMFLVTSMPVGGAETLLVELVSRLDRKLFAPEVVCLKELGPLGEKLAAEMPVHCKLLSNKYDLRIWPRLKRLFRERQIDVVVTVGAGDKMFWGRLAAKRVGVPVIVSALHSTGWPDGVGRLNRWLTPFTDAFVAVAEAHGEHLRSIEGFPVSKVVVIPNGIDTTRFSVVPDIATIRRELGIGATDPVVTLVAALRPEKNHELFLEVARRIVRRFSTAKFLIVGDGPRREELQLLSGDLGLENHALFLGSRSDIPALLSATNVFALTSHNEANPVSILEAMSVGRPVVSVDVGSIHEVIEQGQNGLLVEAGSAEQLTACISKLIDDPLRAEAMGAAARKTVVDRWSVEFMVRRYERLLVAIYARKRKLLPDCTAITPSQQPVEPSIMEPAL